MVASTTGSSTTPPRPRLSLSWSKLAGEETTTHSSSSSSSSSSFADAFFDALPTEPEAVAEEESLYLTLYGTVGAVATTSTPSSSASLWWNTSA